MPRKIIHDKKIFNTLQNSYVNCKNADVNKNIDNKNVNVILIVITNIIFNDSKNVVDKLIVNTDKDANAKKMSMSKLLSNC